MSKLRQNAFYDSQKEPAKIPKEAHTMFDIYLLFCKLKASGIWQKPILNSRPPKKY